MKYHLLFALFFAAFIDASAQRDSGCTLSGHIKGLGNHRLVFNYLTDTGSTGVHWDTVWAHHGNFTYSPRIVRPVYANIHVLKNGKLSKNIMIGDSYSFIKHFHRYPAWGDIVLENRQMKVHARIDTLLLLRASNAPINDTVVYLIRNMGKDIYKLDMGLQKWRKAHPLWGMHHFPASVWAERDSLYRIVNQRHEDSVISFVKAHPDSYASLLSLWYIMRSDTAVLKSVYDILPPDKKQMPEAIRFYESIKYKVSKHIKVGDQAPDISLSDTSGRVIVLSSLRGKYVLLDFWASWCKPCRMESPNLVKAYRALHKKGLEIYSVSLDVKREDWLNAIVKDNLGWLNVSDLKSWGSIASGLYGIRGIPSNYLIDPSGKIIQVNLRGNKIKAEIKKMMK